MPRQAKILAGCLASLIALMVFVPGVGAARSRSSHRAASSCAATVAGQRGVSWRGARSRRRGCRRASARTAPKRAARTAGKRPARRPRGHAAKKAGRRPGPAPATNSASQAPKPPARQPATIGASAPGEAAPASSAVGAQAPAAPMTPTTDAAPTTGTTSSQTPSGTISWTGWNVLSDPIDPGQQTDLPWGTRSDWLQPWRAYLDTPPASTMRNALGINFNVAAQYASPVAQLLGQVGFTRARVEIPWGAMSYADPSQLSNPGQWDTILGALKAAGIRPLILLNANDGAPGPVRTFNGQITATALPGSSTVVVDQTTAQQIVPGLSGFNVPGGPAAADIATSVSPAGVVTLSQPLQSTVLPGVYGMTTLRYPPFAPPFTSTGQPNPAFEQTLQGWLLYVGAVTAEARKVLGGDDFDVEIWNELSFGSAFLNAANYYNPVPAAFQGSGSVQDQLLARTVAWLRDPANGVAGVGIGDGFANQNPLLGGASVPAGVTAVDRHPYYGGVKPMPGYAGSTPQIRDVNALGQPEGTESATGQWSRPFLPTYTAFFPEYFLNGIETDFMERDLSPITTTIGGVPHGRSVAPTGVSTPPQVWVTETGFRPMEGASMTAAQAWHVQAKATLRTLSAFVNKGVTALDFYSVSDGDWSMLNPSAPGGGDTMVALARFMQAFAGPGTITDPRSLSLLTVADQGNWTQFAGDGTAAHPPLYNRDVVAFLPFQSDAHRFVVPVYVMTRNMAQVYNPDGGVDQYDLPEETYRLEIGGVDAAKLQVSATDPLTGDSVPATVVAASGDRAVVQIPLTDSPRLLVLQDG